MFSPRRTAQLGLVSASLVLVVSVGVLVTQGGDKTVHTQGNSSAQDSKAVSGTAMPVSLSANVPVNARDAGDRH
jgi:uncharacterized membrane protein (DUF441 family)